MRASIKRRVVCCGVLASLVLASVVPAVAQESGAKPVAIVAVEKYDGLLGDITFIGDLAGQKQAGQQLEGMLAMFTQGQGLAGVDKTRPWGAVVQTDGFQFTPIVCLPMTDLNATLELVKGMGINVADDGNGMMTIEAPNQKVYIKNAGQWAFAAQQPEMLANAPADPEKLFAELTGSYDVGVKLLVPNIPDLYKQMAVEQMRSGIEQGLQQKEAESDEDFAARRTAQLAQVDQLAKLINESEQITLGLTVDESKGNTYLDVVMTAVAGSELAKAYSETEGGKSSLAGFVQGDPTFSIITTQISSPAVVEQQRPQVEQSFAQLRAQLNAEVDRAHDLPNDEAKTVVKDAANDLLTVLEDTVMTGKIDLAGCAQVTPESFTLVAGAQVVDPKRVETALKQLGALAADEPDAPKFDWDAETVEGVTMHHVSIPVPADEPQAQQMFGETLDITIGIGEEHVYLAAGRDHMEALSQAMSASSTPAAANAGLVEIVVSMESIMKLSAAFNDGPQQPMLEMVAEQLALNSEDTTHVRVTGEQIENGSRVRFEVESGVLEAFGAAGKAMREGAGAGVPQ